MLAMLLDLGSGILAYTAGQHYMTARSIIAVKEKETMFMSFAGRNYMVSEDHEALQELMKKATPCCT